MADAPTTLPASRAVAIARRSAPPDAAPSMRRAAREMIVGRLRDTYREFGPWTAKRKRGITNAPGNFAKGVLGMGPATTALVGAGVRAAPTMWRATVTHDLEAQNEVGAGAVAIGRELASQVVEAVNDPYGVVTKYPFEMLPFATGGARLTAGGVARAAGAAEKVAAARAAAKVGNEAQILKGVAEASNALRKPAEVVAAEGPIKPVARASDAALRRLVKPYDAIRQHMDETGIFSAIKNRADVTEQIARHKDLKEFWKHYGSLTDEQHQRFAAAATSTGKVDITDHSVFRALESFRRLDAQTQAEWLKLGHDLGPLERIPRYQPARIEEFGAAFPRVMRDRAARAASEAGVAEGEINDFIRAINEHGGTSGPIAPERLRAVGRALRGMKVDPQSADPLDIAHAVWKKEARRLAARGLLKREYADDFNAFLTAAKTGSYEKGAAAPLAHQIEGIVKGALTGREAVLPKGLLGAGARAAKPMEAIDSEVEAMLSNKRLRKSMQAAMQGNDEVVRLAKEEATRRAGPKAPDATVDAEMEKILKEWHEDAPPEVMAAAIEATPELRRILGGEVERRLQYRRNEVVQRSMPKLAKLPMETRKRRVYQLTRDEFMNDPHAIKRASQYVDERLPLDEQYDRIIDMAINKRRVVPLEVLQQNDEWFDRALSGPNRRLMRATDEVEEALRQKQTTQPIYIPMMRRPEALNWRNLFRRPEKAAKPGSPFKQRTGKTYVSDDWVKDPRVLAARMTGQLRAHQKAQQIVDGIEKAIQSGEIRGRLISGPHELQPGEVAWNPDGLKMWRQHLEFGQKFIDEMQTFGASEEGAGRALAKAIEKSILDDEWSAVKQGYAKPKVYAIPEHVGRMLTQAYQEAPTAIRYLYDPLQAVWRWSVLTARPAWLMNNVIGNTIFSTLNGVAPRHYLWALNEQFRAKTPETLNGVRLTAQEADLGLVRHGGGPLGETLEWLDSKPTPIGALDVISGAKPDLKTMAMRVGDPRRFAAAVRRVNEAVGDLASNIEGFYRTANFLKEAEKLGRQKAFQRAGKSGLEALSVLDEMDSFSPAEVDKIVAKVNYFMHDYAALTPWERSWLRRAIPFVNFLKHQTRLLVHLPMDYPGRAAMLQALVAVGKEMQAEDNAKLPDWARDRGYVDTGVDLTVDGRPMRAFVASGGWNPFIAGYGPAADVPEGQEEFGLPEAIQFGYQAIGPVLRSLASSAKRGTDLMTGRVLKAPGKLERDGTWYDAKTMEPTTPPWVDPVRYYVGQFPQVQLARKLINPRSGYPGDPLSLDSYRDQATTTRLALLLKYFTPVSIVMIDQKDVRMPPRLLRRDRKALRRQARKEAALREMDRGAWWNLGGRGDPQGGGSVPRMAPAGSDSAGRR